MYISVKSADVRVTSSGTFTNFIAGDEKNETAELWTLFR